MKKVINYSFPALLLVIFALVFFSNCKRASEKSAEKTAEAMMEKALNGADVDLKEDGQKVSIKTKEGEVVYDATAKSWPEGIPTEVPVLKDLKVTASSTSQGPDADSWTVIMEGASVKVLDDYNDALKRAGFKTAIFKMDEGGSVSGEKGNLIVSCMVGEDQVVMSIQRRKS